MGIKLHEKHGLNPSICLCTICGKSHSIALFGAGLKEQAPMEHAQGICEECEAVINNGGVFLIEVKDDSDEKNPYRTGYLVAIKKEALNVEGSVFFIKQSELKQMMGNKYKKEVR